MFALVICYTLLSISCKKNNSTTTDPNNVPGLPPATQSGANTFGCLVDGVPWVPQGNDGGTSNLSIDYDSGLDNGSFNIFAKRILNFPNTSTSIRLGILDSMNFRTVPINLNVSKTSKGYVNHSIIGSCFLNPYENETKATGKILINKHDLTNRIISGTFEATLIKTPCDTIKITNGRFDFKF
jgi:hypothetical protein